MKPRPRIRIPYAWPDAVLEGLGVALLAALWIYTANGYSRLPDSIPMHYNAAGEVDRMGPKSTIWLLPACATVLCLGVWTASRFPQWHNYLVEITEHNAAPHYQWSARVLRGAGLFTILVLGVPLVQIMEQAAGSSVRLVGPAFLLIVIGLGTGGAVTALLVQQRIEWQCGRRRTSSSERGERGY